MDELANPKTALSGAESELTDLLDEGQGPVDAAKGRQACELSRRGHVFIWRADPPAEEARSFREILLRWDKALEGIEGVALYRRNIRLRAASIDNWLNRGDPIFPDEVYEEDLGLKTEWKKQRDAASKERSYCADLLASDKDVPARK
jgi:hypothetical protein